MKILIATGTLNKKMRAPDKLINEISPVFSAHGHKCVVAGICFDAPAQVVEKDNVKNIYLHSTTFFDKALYRFEMFNQQMGGVDREATRKQFYTKHPFSALFIALKYAYKSSYKLTVNSYIRQLKQIIAEEKPDRIIVTYMPTEFAYEVFKLKTDCPKYAYQLDPWGLYEASDANFTKEERISQEAEMFSLSEGVFTTRQLFDQYKEHENYKPYVEKITTVEFPNITIPPEASVNKSVLDFDAKNGNVLFSGVIDDAYRSPEMFLNCIEDRFLKSDYPIKFWFLGTCTSESLIGYSKKYPEKIKLHDRVTPKEANATLQAADFLLNIGNTMTNQVPSKIFDYFSSGKPIINVQKIANCPAREYFDKYPLSFVFDETDNVDVQNRLEQFINENRNKSISFDLVKDIFADSTPEYVSERILNILEKVK